MLASTERIYIMGTDIAANKYIRVLESFVNTSLQPVISRSHRLSSMHVIAHTQALHLPAL
jgi:hypothetical protein